MAKKLLIAIIATFIMLPFFSENEISAVEKGKLDGIDYTRIFTDEKSNYYPATISFGGVNIKGKLKWNGKLEGEQLDECIVEFLNDKHIETSDLISAQRCYDEYLKIDEVKDGYIETVLARLGGIFMDGMSAAIIVDAGSALIRGEWDFYSEEQWRTALSLFDDPIVAIDYMVFTVLDMTSFGDHPVYKAIKLANNIAIVCYQGYQDDMKRWETRIEGVVASRALEEFYKQLNIYLKDKDPTGEWVLNFNGSKTRSFTFMGARWNRQTWNVYINLIKTQDFSGNHVSPAGIYEGVASMELTHNMKMFVDKVWNMKLGRLKKNWYSLCDSLTIDGKKVFKCSKSGGVSIYRFLCSSDAKVYIYTDRLATGMSIGGSGLINATLEYGSFDDYQTLSADCKASAYTASGFTNSGSDDVVGYVISDVAYHLEPNGNNSLTIVQDKGYAEVGLLFNQTKVNDGTREIVTFWDNNIWAPLKSKKANITIKAKSQLFYGDTEE